jgi:uncharacterized protein YdiU (UPF0061 family)
MLPLFDADTDRAAECATASLARFPDLFDQSWLKGMRAKLGLFNDEPEDRALIDELLTWMQRTSADFTNTFRALTRATGAATTSDAEFEAWEGKLVARRARQQQSRTEVGDLMRRHNPAFIPRNHLVEEALQAATAAHDLSVMTQLLDVLARPYDHDRDLPKFTMPGESDRSYRTFCGT